MYLSLINLFFIMYIYVYIYILREAKGSLKKKKRSFQTFISEDLETTKVFLAVQEYHLFLL